MGSERKVNISVKTPFSGVIKFSLIVFITGLMKNPTGFSKIFINPTIAPPRRIFLRKFINISKNPPTGFIFAAIFLNPPPFFALSSNSASLPFLSSFCSSISASLDPSFFASFIFFVFPRIFLRFSSILAKLGAKTEVKISFVFS